MKAVCTYGTKLRETRTVSGTATVIDWCGGIVLEADDYYPLGGPLPTGTSTALQPEKYYQLSPYSFCNNNPINNIDLGGMWHWDATGNLVSDKDDGTETLSKFLNITQNNAYLILSRNISMKDHLAEGTKIAPENIWIENNKSSSVIVNGTAQAIFHYYFGKGKRADVGDKSVEELVSSSIFINKLKTIEESDKDSGRFDVDLTHSKHSFHIGRTNIDYQKQKGINSNTVVLFLFAEDGFWDPNFVIENNGSDNMNRRPDGSGPNLELGGKPYSYAIRKRTYFYKPY